MSLPRPTIRCFVISPIGAEGSDIRAHADDVFASIIEPAMKICHLKAFRSDHLSSPGKISEQLFDEILKDELCVAVLTGFNPNVFYELAIAHTIQKPVIILLAKGESLPFDIRDLRCIFYDTQPRNAKNYVEAIVKQIREYEAKGWKGRSVSESLKLVRIQAPPTQAMTHSRQLYSVTGLLNEDPVERQLFQSFAFDEIENRNPVAYLWADPKPGNQIRANLAKENNPPSLKVIFKSSKGSFPPVIGIHPLGLIAQKLSEKHSQMVFTARSLTPQKSRTVSPVLGLRVVDGFARHWTLLDPTTGAVQKFILSSDYARFNVNLRDSYRWQVFGGTGNREPDAGMPNFSVVSSVVFEFGCGGSPRELGAGQAEIQLADIRFE